MRAYFFGNMYLSSIQQGIQAQHTTAELFIKYNPPGTDRLLDEAPLLFEWASDHKTSILLNGGYSSTLREIIELFRDEDNPFPWVSFNESEDALDGALTCVGIVLPARIYETAAAIRDNAELDEVIRQYGGWAPEEGMTYEISKWEYELCLELNKYGLAS